MRNWSARPTLTQAQAEDNFLKACPLASLLVDEESDDEEDEANLSTSPYPDRERFTSD